VSKTNTVSDVDFVLPGITVSWEFRACGFMIHKIFRVGYICATGFLSRYDPAQAPAPKSLRCSRRSSNITTGISSGDRL
jgi:hypothetical protein